MSKPIYINVFLNDKFSDVTDAMYQKRDQISQETGRNCPPYLSNNKFSPQETITLRANQQYQVSFWFNEREGKRSASISIKESDRDYQGGNGYKKSSGKDCQAKPQDDYDDSVPF